MKFSRLILTILILAPFSLLCVQELNAKPAAVLQFCAFFDKNEYKVDEAIYINFKLKNTGNKPIFVNKRFYLNSESSKPEDREVYLCVTGPQGERLPYKASSYDTGFPKTAYFVLLEAGEEVASERKKNLKAYFDLKIPGKYSITAIYQNVYGAEIGIGAFKGKITSKRVKIKITE